MRYPPLLAALLLLLGAAPLPAQDEARLLRFPATDGKRIVFTYAGNLYTVAAHGGMARRLTSHDGFEMFARFSPDGKWLAFTGQYDGNTEVYLMPAEGGVPRRLTFTATLAREPDAVPCSLISPFRVASCSVRLTKYVGTGGSWRGLPGRGPLPVLGPGSSPIAPACSPVPRAGSPQDPEPRSCPDGSAGDSFPVSVLSIMHTCLVRPAWRLLRVAPARGGPPRRRPGTAIRRGSGRKRPG